MNVFRRRLVLARSARGLTQADLAFELRKLGYAISPGDISRWETGAIQNPGLEKVAASADVLETSTDYLLGRRDELEVAAPATPPANDVQVEVAEQRVARGAGQAAAAARREAAGRRAARQARPE